MEALLPPKSRPTQYSWIATRASLLGRLKNWGDDASWKVFFDTYSPLIYNAVTRAGLSDSEAHDVVQETVISVCRSLPKFKYDAEKGTFKNWLLRVTQRRVADYFRRREAERKCRVSLADSDGENSVEALEAIPDPAARTVAEVWEAEWEQNLWEAALNKLKLKVDLAHYQIYDAYVLQGWEIFEVTRGFNVTATSVYVIKHRLSKLLKKEYEKLRNKPL